MPRRNKRITIAGAAPATSIQRQADSEGCMARMKSPIPAAANMPTAWKLNAAISILPRIRFGMNSLT
jgi:hypothetical protein